MTTNLRASIWFLQNLCLKPAIPSIFINLRNTPRSFLLNMTITMKMTLPCLLFNHSCPLHSCFTSQSDTHKKKKEGKNVSIPSASNMFTVICPLPSHPSSIFCVECTNCDLLKLSRCAFTVRYRRCPSSCWFKRPTEKAAIKERESAACWLGHNKYASFHSWMLK